MRALTASETSALSQASASLGVDPSWLYALVASESSFNPNAKNASSSARGLIQWIDSRARDLGYSGSLDLVQQNPSVEEQLLGPVVQDLGRYAPFPTFEKLVAAVFHPADVDNFDRAISSSESAINAGIRSVQDYADRIRAKYPVAGAVGLGLGFLFFVGAAVYLLTVSPRLKRR